MFLTHKGKKNSRYKISVKKANNGLTDFCNFFSEPMHKKVICKEFQECLAFFFDFIGFYLDTNKEPHFSPCTHFFI